jgi:hypothetical protein
MGLGGPTSRSEYGREQKGTVPVPRTELRNPSRSVRNIHVVTRRMAIIITSPQSESQIPLIYGLFNDHVKSSPCVLSSDTLNEREEQRILAPVA